MADPTPGAGAAASEAATPVPSAPAEAKPAETPAPAAAAAPATPAEAAPATPASRVPEKYALVVPEASKTHADARLLARVEQVGRNSNWSNEDAQSALEEQLEFYRVQAAEFVAETQADPVYGGDHFSETQRLAKKVIDRVRPEGHPRRESFLAFIERGGANNNIEAASFFADLGKLMSEDSPAHGRAPTGRGAATWDPSELYPHPSSRALDEQTRR